MSSLSHKISSFLYSTESKTGWRNAIILTTWKAIGLFYYQPLVLKAIAKHIPNEVSIHSISNKYDGKMHNRIKKDLKKSGIKVVDLSINLNKYNKFIVDANYSGFKSYLGGGEHPIFRIKKALEHFLAYELLQLNSDDIYIDIANANSPVPEIYNKLSGCKSYRQDLFFEKGLNGNVIGGDAAEMPIEDGFATKMALHCSFEHFEGDSDMRFIKEAGRVLRSGGKLCIVPLYLHEEYATVTDPMTYFFGKPKFDKDAKIYFYKYWGNRHERNYNVKKLIERVISLANDFKVTIFYIINEKQIHERCPVKYAILFEKK